MHHIIIGGSIAGFSTAKSIRENDVGARITVICGEDTKPYYRPVIPLVIERNDIDIMFVGDPIERYGISTIYEKVTDIDTRSKAILLTSGQKLNFDRLLIATGSKPIVPDIPGIRGEGVFTLRTLEDALRIKSFAGGKRSALILGGGLVGIKAAVALRHRGLDVVLIEKMEQILPQRLDRTGSEMILKAMKNAGITIMTGETVSEIVHKKEKIETVKLSSGKTVDVDIVIIAIGVKPNADVFKGSGIKINKGILIDEHLQTNISDIYAAGDVVEYKDMVSGMPSVSALWTNAEEMGRLAGKNMVGANVEYRGFLSVMNSTEILNIPFMSIGLIEPEHENYEIFSRDTDGHRKLVFKGDILVGAVLVGNVTHAGIYTNLIKNQIPIGGVKEKAIKGNLCYINFIRTFPVQAISKSSSVQSSISSNAHSSGRS